MTLVKLGDLADLRAGFGFPKTFQGRSSGDLPFAKVGDISRVGRSGSNVLTTADHFIDQADLLPLKARPVPAGSTLFAKIGEAIRQEHRVMAGRSVVIDNNAMAAVPKADVDPRYLFRILQTVKMYSMTSSTTVPALRKSDLELIPVARRDLVDQVRIAAILDKADDIRTKRRITLDHCNALVDAVFHSMFGGAEVRREKLGNLVKFRSGNFLPSSSMVRAGSYSVYGGNGINGKHDQFMFGERKLVLGRVGAYCGVVHVTEPKSWITDNALYADSIPEGISLDYLAAALRVANLNQYSSQSGQPLISAGRVSQVEIALPSFELQQQFSGLVSKIGIHRDKARAQLITLDTLFTSLQYRVFKGEL